MTQRPRRRRASPPPWALLLAACCLLASPSVGAQEPPPASAGPRLTRAPELLRFVEAPWPADAAPEVREAAVLLELTLDAAGRVTLVEVVESGGEDFDAAAMEAARGFLFTPAEVDGATAPIRLRYRYTFAAPPPPVEAPTTAALEGRVLDASGAPLAGVEVRLGAWSARTDAEGRLHLEGLPSGPLPVEIEAPGRAPLYGEEHLSAGERLEVTWRLPTEAPPERGVLLEIVVRAPRLERQAASTQLDAAQARGVPGAGGDVVRVVESLPGVARVGAGQGSLVVWGAAPEDTRVYLDGVPLPRLYHASGVRAVVHPDAVASIALVPGAPGAAWGRGLGGAVLVETRPPQETGLHGSVAVDPLDASASVAAREEGGLWAGAAARYGLIQPLGAALSDDVAGYAPLPRYGDAHLRLGLEAVEGWSVDASALLSWDHVTRGIPNPDPALVTQEELAQRFARASIRLEADHGRTRVTPWLGHDTTRRAQRYGPLLTLETAEGWSAGLRASRAEALTTTLELTWGLDAEVTRTAHTRVGAPTQPAREGDARIYGQPPPDLLSADAWMSTTLGLAPWGEGRLALLEERLRLTAGLRLDPYLRAASRRLPVTATTPEVGLTRLDLALEPRAAAEGDVLPWLTLRVAGARVHQLPSGADTSPVFGTPTLPTARGLHGLAGLTLRGPAALHLEATGFHARTERLPVRVRDDAPPQARALDAQGEGRASGLQLLLRRNPEAEGDVFGWIAYTFARADRRAGEDAAWRPFDFDQPHALTAVAGWSPAPGWSMSARLRYASGAPRTPVLGATWDATRDRFAPRLGPVNSDRLPAFVQLDLRGAWTVRLDSMTWTLSLELLNATQATNAEERAYSPDLRRSGFISSLPLLPLLGLQGAF